MELIGQRLPPLIRPTDGISIRTPPCTVMGDEPIDPTGIRPVWSPETAQLGPISQACVLKKSTCLIQRGETVGLLSYDKILGYEACVGFMVAAQVTLRPFLPYYIVEYLRSN